MKFIDNLYVSKSIKNVKRVIWKMRRNIGQIKVYITTLSKHPTDQLDIYHCSILQQKFFRLDEDFIVVAIYVAAYKTSESCFVFFKTAF